MFFISYFPKSGIQKQTAKELSEEPYIPVAAEQGKGNSGYTSGQSGWEDGFDGKLFPDQIHDAGNQRRRKEEKQINEFRIGVCRPLNRSEERRVGKECGS